MVTQQFVTGVRKRGAVDPYQANKKPRIRVGERRDGRGSTSKPPSCSVLVCACLDMCSLLLTFAPLCMAMCLPLWLCRCRFVYRILMRSRSERRSKTSRGGCQLTLIQTCFWFKQGQQAYSREPTQRGCRFESVSLKLCSGNLMAV